MKKVAQTVLPFKLEETQELLTANAGLALFGEFVQGLGFSRWLDQEMPKPGSGRGFEAKTYVTPLVLMLAGGGRSLEDLRMLKADSGLTQLLQQDKLPSTDAVGDWLRRIGSGAGLAGLERVNQRVVAVRLQQEERSTHTLDMDASQIVAEKASAAFTYKGEQGYMPMIGHLAEVGVIVHEEFRAGNVAPATSNLDFLRQCQARMPREHRITQLRADAATYQAEVFNYCDEQGIRFAIGGRLDSPTLAAIEAIPSENWKTYADCAVAETIHTMNDTANAFRLIVVKYRRQAELFDDRPQYHVIASNREESAETTLVWYRQRGETSENGIKELKIGFGMERMPCGQWAANAAFFRVGVITHNLFVLFRHHTLEASWQRHQVRTVRWRLFHRPGKVVRHARTWVLKVATQIGELFRDIRRRSFALAQRLAL